jgi:shikimate kinase
MGSGKSFTGKKIAASLLWNFLDIDSLVEDDEGVSVAEIFSAHGEKYFREAETRALRKVASKSRTVVACGGGTPCSEENMAVMKETGVVLYLKLTVDELIRRLQRSRTVRPLLHNTEYHDLTARVKEMLELRSSWYEQADIIADGVSSSVEDLAGKAAEMIRARGAFL